METQQTLSFRTTSEVDEKSFKLVFEQLLSETVDNVFSSLGPICKRTIYDYLEKKYKLKKSDFADHIMELSEALEQIFGDAAVLLEIQIMKRLCQKVPQFRYMPEGTLTFPDYLYALSQFFGEY